MFYRKNTGIQVGRSGKLLAFIILSVFFLALDSAAQSTSVDFPTPVTRNEINGAVAARDIGDARLTTHYYLLTGEQGDIFINVVTNNFTGSIDLFAANSLDPVTRIAVYADLGRTETGRAVYLRKPEKLVLRVQGRTPNDDSASYTIKFAGSFAAMSDSDAPKAPELPRVTTGADAAVRVNVVGTVRESPVPESDIKPAAESTKASSDNRSATSSNPKKETTLDENTGKEAAASKDSASKKVESVKPPGKPAEKSTAKPVATRPRTAAVNKSDERPRANNPAPTETSPRGNDSTARGNSRPARPTRTSPPPSPPDPMANFRLIVLFKDGKTIERPMTEVIRFGIDKGTLTIVHKDGTTGKYSMITVAKVSVE